MTPTILGIDIAKQKFDVALLINNKVKNKVFQNNLDGFKALSDWLVKHDAILVHACLEATGSYSEALCYYLADAGHVVSLINPARIKGFAMSELSRTKTDKADAALIARFCAAMRPGPWSPPPIEVRQLQALVQRLDALQIMHTQENNRLAVAAVTIVDSIKKHIAFLETQIEATKKAIRDHIDHHPDLKQKRDLLDSIPGIGEATIAMVLSYLARIADFDSPKKLAAFCGLAPRLTFSGSSVRGKARLSKTGNSYIRKALYMPAIVASRYNPIIKTFCHRLKQSGKSNMVILGAVMRKLLHIIYGVLKSGKPFNPDIQLKYA